MDIKQEKLDKGKIKLTISLPADEMVKYFVASLEKIAPSVELDGFRPGKAPRKLIEEKAGIARILSTALDDAINSSYQEAVGQENLIPITAPKIVVNKYPNYGQTKEEIKSDLEYEAEFEIMPEVVLGDYSKIKIKKADPKITTKDEVEKVLGQLQKQSSQLIEKNEPAEKGDRIEINFEGSLNHVRIDQMSSKNYPVIIGEGTLIPGFEDNLIGLKKGDKKDIKLTFPKDYHQKEYAGKEAEFKIEVLDLKKIVLPEINDDLAKKFGKENIADLKADIEKNLNIQYQKEARNNFEMKVIEAVLTKLKAEIPEGLIERESARMLEDYQKQMESKGVNFDRFLESMKKTRDNIRTEMRSQAEKNVKVGLLLGKIAQEAKFDHHDPEIGKKAMEYLVKKVMKK